MRTPAEIYECLLHSPNRECAVAGLTDAELVAVGGMLLLDYDENTVTGELLGLCLVASAGRFATMTQAARMARAAKNGEGFL